MRTDHDAVGPVMISRSPPQSPQPPPPRATRLLDRLPAAPSTHSVRLGACRSSPERGLDAGPWAGRLAPPRGI